jgi:hypothetical protein
MKSPGDFAGDCAFSCQESRPFRHSHDRAGSLGSGPIAALASERRSPPGAGAKCLQSRGDRVAIRQRPVDHASPRPCLGGHCPGRVHARPMVASADQMPTLHPRNGAFSCGPFSGVPVMSKSLRFLSNCAMALVNYMWTLADKSWAWLVWGWHVAVKQPYSRIRSVLHRPPPLPPDVTPFTVLYTVAASFDYLAIRTQEYRGLLFVEVVMDIGGTDLQLNTVWRSQDAYRAISPANRRSCRGAHQVYNGCWQRAQNRGMLFPLR